MTYHKAIRALPTTVTRSWRLAADNEKPETVGETLTAQNLKPALGLSNRYLNGYR
jgi:hypothetical protein